MLTMRSLFIVCTFLTLFSPARADERTPQKYQSLLARECDALIATAVKRPYGWAWELTSDQDSKKTPRSVAISLEPAATPAAGLLLLYAGDLLHEPKYSDAAGNVARGI